MTQDMRYITGYHDARNGREMVGTRNTRSREYEAGYRAGKRALEDLEKNRDKD